MKVPFLDLKVQYNSIKDEVNSAIKKVLDQNNYILGPHVEQFENEFARFCGAKFCIALNSGTSALHSALLAHGIGDGDEVITVPNTFIATTWVIDYCDAIPVFVDVEKDTLLMDYKEIEPKINSRTKAIIPVHLYGQPANMKKINEIAKKYNLLVIEDAAQAHGAKYDKKIIGSLGNTTCFSFYPGKNLGAYGEGGAVVTDDNNINKYIRSLRDHAQSKKYHHEFLGYNYRMDAIQGAVLNIKLKYLEDWTSSRNRVARLYQKKLKDLKNIKLPYVADGIVSAFHLFVIHTPERDKLFKALKDSGVSCGLHYPIPIHLQKAYNQLGYQNGSFPNAEKNAKQCISLPMYPEMSDEMVNYICKIIYKYFD